MLAIKREPLYKNKIALSSLAVLMGFGVTAGLIRAVAPDRTADNQSTQSTSDRRATAITPINASDSESSTESADKASQPERAASLSATAPNSSSWTTQSTSGQASAAQSPTTQQNTASPTASQPTSASQNPTPNQEDPAVEPCAATIPIVGSLICQP